MVLSKQTFRKSVQVHERQSQETEIETVTMNLREGRNSGPIRGRVGRNREEV